MNQFKYTIALIVMLVVIMIVIDIGTKQTLGYYPHENALMQIQDFINSFKK